MKETRTNRREISRDIRKFFNHFIGFMICGAIGGYGMVGLGTGDWTCPKKMYRQQSINKKKVIEELLEAVDLNGDKRYSLEEVKLLGDVTDAYHKITLDFGLPIGKEILREYCNQFPLKRLRKFNEDYDKMRNIQLRKHWPLNISYERENK